MRLMAAVHISRVPGLALLVLHASTSLASAIVGDDPLAQLPLHFVERAAVEEREADRFEAPAEPNEPLPSSPIILVVEDDDAVRNVLGRALQRAGYNVLSAGNSTQALQISAQHDGPIHLIVSDVVMPKMKGPELAERIRRDRPTTKLLLISGYTDPGVENPSGIDAATPFLQKPFTPEALVNTVEEVLGRDIPGAGGGRRRIDP